MLARSSALHAGGCSGIQSYALRLCTCKHAMIRAVFDSIYSHGFIRAAVCIPAVHVAEPRYNAARTVALANRAADANAAIALFPELGLSAYSNEDLFHQDALLEATVTAIGEVVSSSRDLGSILVVGAPLRFDGKLFNCAIAIYRGRDRKSTRLNSSHPSISYAVFCLKK